MMANHHHQQQQQHEKKKMDHFSHKHPLTLIDIEEDEKEQSKSDEYSKNNTSLLLRCYGCTEKIVCGVPYYRCKEHCPSFCLHHSCAHLPTTIRRWHSPWHCDHRDLQLMKRPNKDYKKCAICWKDWYRFGYVCSVCKRGIDVRCAVLKGPNEAKHSFHQHPLQPFSDVGKVQLLQFHCTSSMYKCSCEFRITSTSSSTRIVPELQLHCLQDL